MSNMDCQLSRQKLVLSGKNALLVSPIFDAKVQIGFESQEGHSKS